MSIESTALELAPISELPAVHRKLQALIVEDDLTWEPLWAEVLKAVDAEAEYTWATSETEATNEINARFNNGEEFDVVITDIFISGSKTGLDLFEAFKEKLAGRFVIASGVDLSRLKSQLAGAKEPLFLNKPFRIEECVKTVRSLFQRDSSLGYKTL